jgi:mannose-6-phosphate isomerase-like protein (cupin superfamily)
MDKTQITEFIKKSFNNPDERAEPPETIMEIVKLGNFTVSRLTFEPGWRWSESLPSYIGTDTCQYEHPVWMILSGRFAVQMDDDGRTEEYGPGDLGMIPPGHDAWVVGDEPVVGIDIQIISNGK